jgi:NAD(P)-dependent dehydrogenase (short-subunit alcohol dehydrogenase family)
VINGASRGLGRGTAIELARAGATVLLAARTAADLDDVVETIASLSELGVRCARPPLWLMLR